MTRVVYYVAASLDGFIAGPKGELDWLHAFESPAQDYGYADFLAGVDALVMGRKTYELARGFGPWPYGQRPAWLLSRSNSHAHLPSTLRLTRQTPSELLALWRQSGLGRVWLVGGGDVAGQFLAGGCIGEFMLATIPVTLGRGIDLFGETAGFRADHWALQDERRYPNGVLTQRWSQAASAASTSLASDLGSS